MSSPTDAMRQIESFLTSSDVNYRSCADAGSGLIKVVYADRTVFNSREGLLRASNLWFGPKNLRMGLAFYLDPSL